MKPRRDIEPAEETVAGLWNDFAQANGLSTIIKITSKRRAAIYQRLQEEEFDLEKIFEEIRGSALLLGNAPDFKGEHSGWKVDFDFVFCSANNYVKILEGKYRNRVATKQQWRPPEQRNG